MGTKIWVTIAAITLSFGGMVAVAATPAGADSVTVSMNCRAQAPVIGDQLNQQTLHIDGAAPESAPPGANFATVATFDVGQIPSQQDGGTISGVKDLSYRIPVPANVQFVSASLSGGFNYGSTPPTATIQGSTTAGSVFYKIPGPIPADQDFQVPALRITFKAIGADGSTVGIRLGGVSYDDPGFTTTAMVTSPIQADVPTQCYPVAPNPDWTSTTIVGADHTAPTISVTTPADNAQFPQGALVSASYKCTDNPFGSGVASCSGTLANGAAIDTSELGTFTFTVTSSDNAGNASVPVSHTYSVVPGGSDHTPPTISVTTPADGAVIQQGAVVNAAYACADTDSGIGTCIGTVANGAAIDTATVGARSFSVAATDNEGNPHTVLRSYRVVPAPAAQTITSGDVANQIPVLCNNQFQTAHKTIPVTTNTAPATAGTGTQFTWTHALGADFVPALQNGTALKYRWKAPTNGHFVSAGLTSAGSQVTGAAIAVKADGALELTIATVTDQGGGTSQDAFTPPAFQAVVAVDGGNGTQVRTQFDYFDITTAVLGLPVPTAHHCPGGDAAFNGRTNPFLTTTNVVDRTPPTITIVGPTHGRSVDPGQSLTFTYSCSDDVGTPTCTGTQASGSTLQTGTSGVYQVSVTAVDAAGNTAKSWVTYTVSDPEVSIAAGSASESDGTRAVTLRLSNPSTHTVIVTYGSADGTATSPDDFLAVNGAVTFAPGGPLSSVISVPIVDDDTFEPNESFTVEILGTLRASVDGNAATVTIIDDDVPPLEIADASVKEGPGATLDFALTLAGPPHGPMTVDYFTSDGSAKAPARYAAKSGTLVFQPGGPLVQHVLVPVVNDGTWNASNPNPAASMFLTAVSDGAVSSATGTIIDDEISPPTVNIGSVTLREGDTYNRTASIPITLSRTSTNPVSVTFATAAGTADDSDFKARSGTIVFNAGQLTKYVTITVRGDALPEANDTFDLVIVSLSNSFRGHDRGTTTILDDDHPTASAVQMAVSDVSVYEGGVGKRSTVTFNVTLNRRPVAGTSTTVHFATQVGSAGTGDFTGRSGTLTFGKSITSKTVVVNLRPDTIVEGNEAFQLVLSNPIGTFTITDGVGTATVFDDE